MDFTKAESIFGGWMASHRGLNDFQIISEVKILRTCETLDDYKRVSRKGQTFALNRAERISIWQLMENAQEHAGYEEWAKTQ